MAKEYGRHIGENQMVYGMPKKMHASANLTTGELAEHGASGEEMKTYWRYHPKPNACGKCKAVKGILFEEYPGPVHRNCKCEIEQIATNRHIDGHTDILVPPGVDLAANIAEARRVKRWCEEQAQRLVSRFDIPLALFGPPFALDMLKTNAIDSVAFCYKCQWLISNFNTGKRYDFKKKDENGQYHPEYEGFGNYHYGLYTKAMEIDVDIAQAAAGAVQIWSENSSWDFWSTWYDDPQDNALIKQGQRFPLY